MGVKRGSLLRVDQEFEHGHEPLVVSVLALIVTKSPGVGISNVVSAPGCMAKGAMELDMSPPGLSAILRVLVAILSV
jgi:hypothetical protein